MATLLAHIKIRPGLEARWEELCDQLYQDTYANETDVHLYQVWRGEEEGTYYFLESFSDFNAFLKHQASDHHEAAAPVIEEVFDHWRLEWVDPVPAASSLGPTNMTPLSPTATELEKRFHEQFAVHVQEWWLAMRAQDEKTAR